MRVKLTSAARSLRRRQTDAEQRLWYHLRNKQMDGIKFKRQVPRGDYIVDFLTDEVMLVIELDGSQHALRTIEDQMRTDYLTWLGYDVLRFWNADVMTKTTSVLEVIYARACDRRKAPQPPFGHLLPTGRRRSKRRPKDRIRNEKARPSNLPLPLGRGQG